ncbi:MAG: hypothetical protein HC933_00370 [Pleurocapsa sp. SU_196_0]|nr:hypothetical protein [Pleurocapsa sp. SU_196_0]
MLQRSSVAGKKVPDKRKFWIIAGSVGALALVGFFAMSATPSKKAEGPNLLGNIAGKDVRGKPGTTLPDNDPTSSTAPSSPSSDAAPAPDTVNAALALPAPLRNPASPGASSNTSNASTASNTATNAAPRYGVTSAPPYATTATTVPSNPSAPYRSAAVNDAAGRTANVNANANDSSNSAARVNPSNAGRTLHVVAPRSGVLGAAALPPTGQSPLAQPATLPGSPFTAPPSGAPGSTPGTAPSSVVSRPSTPNSSRTVSVPIPTGASTVRTAPTTPRSSTVISSAAVPVPVTSSLVRPASSSTTTFVRAGSAGGSVNVQGASASSGSMFTRVGSPPLPTTAPVTASPAEPSSPVQPSIPVPPPTSTAAPAPPPVTTALTAPGLELLIPGIRLGDRLEAKLMTTVIAVENGTSPLVAQTTGDYCPTPPCAPILWIGEAFLGTDKRVHGRLTRASSESVRWGSRGNSSGRISVLASWRTFGTKRQPS